MVDAIFTCLSDRLPRVLRRLQPGGVRPLIGRHAGWSIRLDLFASFSTNDDADAGLPALLAAAGARAATTPTALAQTRLPTCAHPADAAFDKSVAATIAAWRATRRIK